MHKFAAIAEAVGYLLLVGLYFHFAPVDGDWWFNLLALFGALTLARVTRLLLLSRRALVVDKVGHQSVAEINKPHCICGLLW